MRFSNLLDWDSISGCLGSTDLDLGVNLIAEGKCWNDLEKFSNSRRRVISLITQMSFRKIFMFRVIANIISVTTEKHRFLTTRVRAATSKYTFTLLVWLTLIKAIEARLMSE